ncbi:MAG: super-infection exclusion protein B [Neisseria sp.]|nr:super-infection exclusion protein B [Neisseria sp.]
MENLFKWLTESVSVVRIMLILFLVVLCYLFAPEALNARLDVVNPVFAPEGFLRFVLFFSGSFLVMFVTAPLLEGYVDRRLKSAEDRAFAVKVRQAEDRLNNLSQGEWEIMSRFVQNGFGRLLLTPSEAVVISLVDDGLIEQSTGFFDGGQSVFYLTATAERALRNKAIASLNK